jgi:hypothetical protein
LSSGVVVDAVSPPDEDGEFSLGENADADRDITPDVPTAPSVKTFDVDQSGIDSVDQSAIDDVDDETLRAFVVCVIYANAALLLVSLGPLVWFFEGWTQIGAASVAAGLLAGIRTYQTYRAWDQSRDDTDDAGADDTDPDDAGADDTDPDDAGAETVTDAGRSGPEP